MLHIGGLKDTTVRVSLDPYLSVLALITDALGGRRRGAPAAWRRRVRESIAPQDVEVVRPMTAPGHSVVPNCVTPLNPIMETSVEDQVQRLHDLSEQDLLDDLEYVFGGDPPSHWRPVINRPRRWLEGYARVAEAVWSAMEPVWRQARPLMNREIERVGAASVRGQLDVILGGIHPRSRLVNGVLEFQDPEPAQFRLNGRPIVLVPMLSGGEALICSLDQPDAVWLGYPVPGVGQVFHDDDVPVRDTSLELLLGPVRAQVLAALSQSLTMGELANRTGLAPSAITYHCERLAAVGLVERERRGREVRVSRTERAEKLVDLFSS